jgi:hypothetical protein
MNASKTLKIEGYKTVNVSIFRMTDKADIYTGYVTKEKGKKPVHVTVQEFINGLTKVYTVEGLKNIEHTSFQLV